MKQAIQAFKRLLGPGLVTGAADDDPSGIATYSQAGAQFGYGLLWTVFLTTPFMIAIQLVSAKIGRVTGKGIVASLASICPRPLVLAIVALLVTANTINIAADLAAMGEALVAGHRRIDAGARADFRGGVRAAASLRSLPALCPGAQVSDRRVALLRVDHLRRACALGRSGTLATFMPAPSLDDGPS